MPKVEGISTKRYISLVYTLCTFNDTDASTDNKNKNTGPQSVSNTCLTQGQRGKITTNI